MNRSVTKDQTGWSAHRPLWMGAIGVFVLLGGFGTWATFTDISGAIIASGQIAVERNRQVVQHPDGGVVRSILVSEGDVVEVGQTLIQLDDVLLRSNVDILQGQLYEIEARAARLRAERDNATEITYSDTLLAAAATIPDVADIVDGQTRLFEARAQTMRQEIAQLTRRKAQIASQIEGIEAQQDALSRQLGFIGEELTAQRDLLAKGLAQVSRVLSLQREDARLSGQVGEMTAAVAESQGRITEIDIEILKIGDRRREDAITQLRDLQFRLLEMAEQLRSSQEQLSRMEITAPVAGVVYGMSVFAERSVIRPADPVLFIIPQDRPLVIQAQVDPIHIDQVYRGQPATLRMSTFDTRTTPELFGTVVQISADAFSDEATGRRYYRAELIPNEGELDKLSVDQVLLPGMPVEAYLRTEDRTPLAYLIKPVVDYFNKAFRES